jgi:DNA-binding NtrC family response regulator
MLDVLLGGSGSGKTFLAEWLHRASGRRGRLEVVECTRWPAGGAPNFMTAALFGQLRNAFPGAAERRGACELATGGTLLLDEVADLRPELQGMLLRAMERRVIRRLGSSEDLGVSFRLLSATNRPPEELRSDFYFRISAGDPIVLPPLRERPEDVAWLARKEIARLNAERAAAGEERLFLDGDALCALEGHEWPGNARELAQAIRNAAVLATGGVISPQHLPAAVRARSPASAPVTPARGDEFSAGVGEKLDSVVRRYLLACWVRVDFDAPRAAELAGVGRATLWRTLRRTGLELLCRIALDGESLEAAAAAIGIPGPPAARLLQEIESYLRTIGKRELDVVAKAMELGIAPERLAAVLAARR